MSHEVNQTLNRVIDGIGGAHRSGQQQMAEVVWETITKGEHSLVEAGTGTGKSLAYLVPTLCWAAQGQGQAVISTATLALQRQILNKDAPAVVEVLSQENGRAPSLALLKGWNNYICLHKLSGGYPQDTLFEPDQPHEYPLSQLEEEIARLRTFAQNTETGDRDEVEGISDRAWRQASVSKRECLGQRCPLIEDCFPEQARQQANEADVIITNHAMLGIVASGNPGALPDHDVLIIDEAHELPARVTTQATKELSSQTVLRLGRLVRRHGGIATSDLDDAAHALGTAFDEGELGRIRGGLPTSMETAVREVHQQCRELAEVVRSQISNGATKLTLTTELSELLDITERALGDDIRSGEDVAWIEDTPGGGQRRLVVAPRDVSGPIANHLLSDRAVVATSATLALGKRFEPLARDMGFFENYATQRVASPFDYRRQAILYTPSDLPPPGRDGTDTKVLEELTSLMDSARGRTLGLFSSRRAAEEAAAYVRAHSSHRVMVQGEDGLPKLVSRFAEDEDSSLFGTLSLWQGVDVPGRACSVVIIDRIPFPRPDDPLASARAEAAAEAGGNGFMAVSATHAALLLAQGAGRLIRSVEDKGVVAILDSRVVTRRYGSFLRSSLPPFWHTTNREVVHSALGRLSRETSMKTA